MTPQPKTLVLDIETSLAIYAAYPSNKPQYLGHKNMLKDWFIICFGWQWEGADKVHKYSLLNDPKRFKHDPTDDYAVVKKMHEVISDCDAIVGHNMSRFDWGKFMARVIYHGLPPVTQPKIIDTLKQAKKFKFSHNSLDYLTKYLKISEKREHSGDMWLRILRGDKSAIKECIEYCGDDIPATMALYQRLKPHMPATALPNHNVWRGDGVDCCRACGSTDIIQQGWCYSRTTKKKQWRCKQCGSWSTSKKSVKTVLIS